MLTDRPWKIETLLQMLLGIFGGITFSGLLAVGLGYSANPGDINHVMMLVGAVSVHGVGVFWLNWFIQDHGLTWREVLLQRVPALPRVMVYGAAMGVCGFYACMYLGAAQGEIFRRISVDTEPQSTVVALQSSVSVVWIVFFGIVSVVLAPVVEETLFRGILYPIVKQLGYPRLALWGVSLLFAASHANLHAFIPLTFLALALTWLYEQTDQLIAPVIAHATFNAINFTLTIQYGALSTVVPWMN